MKQQIDPPGTPEPSLTMRTSVEDLVRLSSSFDGFKRENVVRRLGMIGDPTAIPALMMRANDWVPQVRTAAYDALNKMLISRNASAFISSLPLLLHLQKCTRGDHRELMQSIQEFLIRDGNVETLKAAWHSEDPQVARFVARVLIAQRTSAPAQIVIEGLSRQDVSTRAIVIDLLCELEAQEFEQVVPIALRDRYMPVRREAFQQLMRRFPKRGLDAAKRLLFDSSAAMRELALRHLSAVGEPVEEMYSSALGGHDDRAAVVRCVLWAWGVMNARSRLSQVEQRLTSQYPSVRRAALQAFAKLSPGEVARHLEMALSDRSASVAKEAARLIGKLGIDIDVDKLIALARARNELHVTQACHRIARCGCKWDWLKFVLSVFPVPGCGVSTDAFHRELQTWDRCFNHGSTQPNQRTRHEIEALIRTCQSQLQPAQVQSLIFTLRTC